MRRNKTGKPKQSLPGTVIDSRGVTLSAGVAAFDEALVKQFRDAKAPAGTDQITSGAFGEEGPADIELPLPHPHRDDAI